MAKKKIDVREIKPLDIIRQKKLRALNKRYFVDLIKKIIVLIIVIYIVSNFIFGFKLMPNTDMTPRISAADLLVYYRLDKKPLAGDVIVFEHEGVEYVLRVVATGGDEVDITEDGLIINGSIQGTSSIYFSTGIYEEGIDLPVKLEEDEVFVLGDLRQGARDSRYFGPIKYDEILGKVFILIRRTQF